MTILPLPFNPLIPHSPPHSFVIVCPRSSLSFRTHTGAIEDLRRAMDSFLAVATSELPFHAHIDAGERETIIKECEAASNWLHEKQALQAEMAKVRDGWVVVGVGRRY
jgi:hypothetical protein